MILSRRRHPFLEKNPKIGRVNRRRDGDRPSGEPVFKLEDEEGVLWRRARREAQDGDDLPPDR